MSAPTLDRNSRTSTQTGPSTGPRRRRSQLVLVASALVVLAIAVGTSLAIATRPSVPQATADPGLAPVAVANHQNVPSDQNANADQGTTAQPGQGTQSGTATKPDSGTKSRSETDSSATSGAATSLGDGIHPAYITRVDRANDRIVVDVVQVFQGDRAVKEAIADGKPRSEAQYLTTYVRNQNSRLRTLPLASGLVVKLWGSCEETAKDRDAVLAQLAANASQTGTYYYDLTVSHGKVQRIEERLAINAC
jgi:hypothetical protein